MISPAKYLIESYILLFIKYLKMERVRDGGGVEVP